MSDDNMDRAAKLKETAQRIREESERDGECLVWKGAVSGVGYGYRWFMGHNIGVHRLTYEAEHGPIPPGHVVRHTCDRPLCVEPMHLITGTHQQNMDDMVERGRTVTTKRPPLSDEELLSVEGLWTFLRTARREPEDWTQQRIADAFGIDPRTVRRILADRERIEKATERELERIGSPWARPEKPSGMNE